MSATTVDFNCFYDRPETKGYYRLETQSIDVDSRGIGFKTRLLFPAFQRVIYWCYPVGWPNCDNKTHPFVAPDFGALKEGGIFLLLELTDGNYLALLPLSGDDGFAWFAPEHGQMYLAFGNLGKEHIAGDSPFYAWAFADNPYKACHDAWEQAFSCPGIKTRSRSNKEYPQMFEYLGWCSWMYLFENVDEEKIIDSVRKISDSAAPIRFIVLDDGHQHNSLKGENIIKQLKSLRPDPEKFPEGYTSLLAEKRENGVKWMGLWFALSGARLGMSADHEERDLDNFLEHYHMGGLFPRSDSQSTRRFMEAMLRYIGDRSGGRGDFNFVKIDFMTWPIKWATGALNREELVTDNAHSIANPHRQSVLMRNALEDVLYEKGLGLLNCNWHNPQNIFSLSHSNAGRSCNDYGTNNLQMAKELLYQCFANSPWISQILWGDYDMFHSSDELATILAVSRALSGGPVYLSDPVEALVPESVFPLCFSDGRLLRPLAPAAPLPDSLFFEYDTPKAVSLSPESGKPYRVIAPLSHGCAAIACFNFNKESDDVSGLISADDYHYASSLLQPWEGFWQVPDEGLVLYDWFSKKDFILDKPYNFTLKGFACGLFILAPVHNGYALIGDTEKFLSPQAIRSITYVPGGVDVEPYEESGKIKISKV